MMIPCAGTVVDGDVDGDLQKIEDGERIRRLFWGRRRGISALHYWGATVQGSQDMEKRRRWESA